MACGGRSRQGEAGPIGVEPGGSGPGGSGPGGTGPVQPKACFSLSPLLPNAELGAAVLLKLGVSVGEGAVDENERNARVRAQQLVDAVERALEQGVPAESRQILRGFVGGLVGEATPPPAAGLSEGVAAAMQQELDSFADHWLLDEKGSLEALLASSTTWVNGELAEHYGLPRPASSNGERVELPVERRAGIMTLGAFLTRRPLPPDRAMFLFESLACNMIPPPPVMESVWDQQPRPAAKSIVVQSYGDDQVSCNACHRYYVGYAIALDRYDELGRYRDSLDGVPIDTSYKLTMPGFEPLPGPNDGQDIEFSTPAELGRAVSESGGVRACLVKKLNEQLGSPELNDAELACVLGSLQEKQGNFRSLLAILSPRFVTSQ